MKPTFKTTALAILVSLGVTACGSSSSKNSSVTTPVNEQAQTDATEQAAKEAAEKAAAEKAAAEQAAKEAAEKAAAEKAAAEKAAKEAAEKAAAEQAAKEAAEKAAAEKVAAEQAAKEAAEKAAAEKAAAEQAAKEAAEKAAAEKAAAEQAAKEAAEKAAAEKAAAEQAAKEAAEKAAAEKAAAEQAAKEAAEKAAAEKAAAEQAAKEAAEKAAAEKAAAEQAAKEAAEKAAAEKAAKEAAEKAAAEKVAAEKVAAEKAANQWRTAEKTRANITAPQGYYTNNYNVSSPWYKPSNYVKGYDGTKENVPVRNNSNSGYKLDYYQLAIEDKDNPQVLGWYKGEIKSSGINGSEITKFDENNEIVERSYPEKVNYIFKNTPYATYGATYNNYEANLFVIYDKGASLSSRDGDYYQVGEYEVLDGNKTTKIKYNDAVKGAATYKGEVLAHSNRSFKLAGGNFYRYVPDVTPEIDGTITINANFGTRNEENFATATLDSKILGKIEFGKARMSVGEMSAIQYNTSSSPSSLRGSVYLNSTVVGKNADEMVGDISYKLGGGTEGLIQYEAVFAAEKQPK